MPGRDLHERPVGGLGVQPGRDDHGHRTAGPGHPAHLGEGALSLGKEHERHLADDGVEALVGEWQIGHVALAPLDVGPDPAGDGQHRLVEVDPGDRSAGGHLFDGGAGHDAGAAGHVEQAAAGPTSAASSRGAAHSAKIEGTNVASYASAVSRDSWKVSGVLIL